MLGLIWQFTHSLAFAGQAINEMEICHGHR
jgi:hypothetical protein